MSLPDGECSHLLLVDGECWVWVWVWVSGVGGWQPDLPLVLRRLVSGLAT
jgi:hypothetical protein